MTVTPPLREIPTGSGINGRPLLGDDLRRHLAYRVAPGADGAVDGIWGWTWCGLWVPDDHMCPHGNNGPLITAIHQRPLGNCSTCHDFYMRDFKAVRRLPDWA